MNHPLKLKDMANQWVNVQRGAIHSMLKDAYDDGRKDVNLVDTDHYLPKDELCWITANEASILITTQGEGVGVNIYPVGREEGKSIGGIWVDNEELKPQGEYSIPEIDAWFDEAEYLRLSNLIRIAAGQAGDGAGGELGENSEYERGMAELIIRTSHVLGMQHLDQVIQAIHNTAKES